MIFTVCLEMGLLSRCGLLLTWYIQTSKTEYVDPSNYDHIKPGHHCIHDTTLSPPQKSQAWSLHAALLSNFVQIKKRTQLAICF